MYQVDDLEWLDICVRLRSSGMPVAEIRRYAGLVRDGGGNEHERLGLLREHQNRVTAQIAELNRCLEVISHKVKVYEEHVAGGTAGALWTASGG
ncbi:MAG TPA: MerR family DNA-binding protein [Kribbellaceae bacterium]